MKKTTLLACAALLGTAILLTTILTGCFKDHCTKTFTYYLPIYQTTPQVRANIKSSLPCEISLPGKLFMYGHYIFLNERNKGIHIIDNTNPASPNNIAFINIPGNIDMAVKGNILYADSYTDLVTIDITDPLHAKTLTFISNAFPNNAYCYMYYGTDSAQVVIDWVKRDTTVSMDCERTEEYYYLMENSFTSFSALSNKSTSPFGLGGSMARFALTDKYLYTVTTSKLNSFNITAPKDPKFENKTEIGWNIETIFPFRNKLFIGSSDGMFIYNIANGKTPVKESQFQHVRSCDPVVADEKFAYVTLRSGTKCQGFTNQLEILDIADIKNPLLLKTYSMTNPHGLGKDGNLLFICDGKDGLKVYNAQDINNLQLLSTITGIETYDVIATNKTALVVASDGLYQYNYSNPANITLLSKITYPK